MTARCICDPWAAEEECRVHNPARLPCPRCHLLWPVRDGFIVCPAHGSYDVDELWTREATETGDPRMTHAGKQESPSPSGLGL